MKARCFVLSTIKIIERNFNYLFFNLFFEFEQFKWKSIKLKYVYTSDLPKSIHSLISSATLLHNYTHGYCSPTAGNLQMERRFVGSTGTKLRLPTVRCINPSGV